MTRYEPLNGDGGCGDAWLGLCKVAWELREQHRWVFRGVAKQSYRLVPGIGRPDARKNSDQENLPYESQRERALLEEFKRQRNETFGSLSDAGVMAVGQHHGLATRLLDWSQSLFAAAYFATEYAGENSDEDACIYGLRGAERLEQPEDPFSVPDGEIRLFWPPHAAPRIVAQRGLFTVHGSPHVPFEPLQDSPIQLRRWLLPRGELFKIKLALDTAGINRAALFPDTDGIAKHLSWAYKRDRLPTDSDSKGS
jgi:hypothetical protein